jgi:hypothetical protein
METNEQIVEPINTSKSVKLLSVPVSVKVQGPGIRRTAAVLSEMLSERGNGCYPPIVITALSESVLDSLVLGV